MKNYDLFALFTVTVSPFLANFGYFSSICFTSWPFSALSTVSFRAFMANFSWLFFINIWQFLACFYSEFWMNYVCLIGRKFLG